MTLHVRMYIQLTLTHTPTQYEFHFLPTNSLQLAVISVSNIETDGSSNRPRCDESCKRENVFLKGHSTIT